MATEKSALITGVTGQDGSYLAELLLAKGYAVHGMVRRASTFNRERIDHLRAMGETFPGTFRLHYGDMSDGASLLRLLTTVEPDEVYHLAAQSHVRVSFDIPEYTADATGLGTARLLEAIRQLQGGRQIRFYQASSSELYGKVHETPQSESTRFHPRSPYACAKAFAHFLTVNYREAYGMHASCGILFNHESPRRGESFVTRKLSLAAARIKRGLQKEVVMGNLEAKRDWGYAPDYVEAMWRMLQQDEPDDYVVATGQTWKVEEFADLAFRHVGLNWRDHIRFDAAYTRPSEVDLLIGDPSKAKAQLGWEPRVTMPELPALMVEADLRWITDGCTSVPDPMVCLEHANV
jgi:GDPmannose 4,6-dehydratase